MSENATEAVETEQTTEPKSVLLTEGSFVATPEPEKHDETKSESCEETQSELALPAELNEQTENAIQETLSEKLDKISIHEEDDKESGYVTPVADPYARAIRYMEQHNVMQIFQKLTAEIIYHRPDDPLNHMLDELHKMKKEREDNPPPPVTPE